MFILLGSPGAGKSTQAELLQERLGYNWISTGRLLRETGDPKILEMLNTGDLLPNDIVQEIFEDALEATPPNQEILVDGYPRDDEQIEITVNYIAKKHRPIKAIVYIELDRQVAIDRMMSRGREGETLGMVRHRIVDVFEKEIQPILDGFEKHGHNIIKVDGDGDIEEVYSRLEAVFKELDPNGGAL